MIFLTIPSVNGETFTINPNQIIFIGDLTNGECWIQLPKTSIRISEEIYTDLLRHIERVTIDIGETNTIPKDMKCEDLELTVRLANCLSNLGIIYVHQLLDWSTTDFLKSKNFGRKSLNELREILKERFNVKLKGE